VCVCVCVCVYVCVYVCVCMNARARMFVCMYGWVTGWLGGMVCLYGAYVRVCVHTCLHTFHTSTYTYHHKHAQIHIYIHVYIFIRICRDRPSEIYYIGSLIPLPAARRVSPCPTSRCICTEDCLKKASAQERAMLDENKVGGSISLSTKPRHHRMGTESTCLAV